MKSIDILLVNPINRRNRPAYVPYGIAYIAAYVRKLGIDVKIFDRNAETESFNNALEKYVLRVVGFSVLTGPTINDAIEMSKQVRKILKDSKIVWGGVHSTLFTKQCLAEPYIDITVNGEGEFTTADLTKVLVGGKHLGEVKGISFKEGSRIITTPSRELIADLDKELPLPAWDLLDMKQYIGPKFYASRVVTFNTSRGCHFRCAFCHNPLSHNRRNWRGFSAAKIVEGLEILKNNYNINGVYFMEDEFDSNQKRRVEFVDLMIKKKLGLKWHKTTRVNFVTDKESMAAEYESGLRFIEFGVESGSDRMLKFIKKDQTTKMIRRAFQICREVGIKTNALFILGLPTETREEFEETRRFITELNPHIYMGSYFKPFPGSELYQYPSVPM